MDENRRSFLKKTGCTALGLGCGFPLLSAGCGPWEHSDHDAPSASQLAMVIDLQKCAKQEVREACIKACKEEHNWRENSNPDPADEAIPDRSVKWIWKEDFKVGFPDQSHLHTQSDLQDLPVLLLCNHCSNPACVRVCPTAATWKREVDGVVMMDMHRCIGCRYCVVACPYGSRSFNWAPPRPDMASESRSEYPTRSRGVVEKCSFCTERIRAGREPACVEAANKVPGGEGALTFGDLADSDSDVCRLLRENRTICRRIGLGTGPNVYYIV
jgi:molybdopterin-containing oxidoreductase family iron-sulfur binding subunit